jgi:hypothetical protein
LAKYGSSLRLLQGLLLAVVVVSGCSGPGKVAASLTTTRIALAGNVGPRTRVDNAPPPATSQAATPRPNVQPTGGGPQTSGPAPLPPPTQVAAGPGSTGGSAGSTSSSGGGGSSVTIGPALLQGLVAAPSAIISNNGASLVSNNGSSIISNNGAAIISNNGAAIISNNGAAVISNNGGSYRTLDVSGPEGRLANAYVYVTNRDEKFFFNTTSHLPFVTTTDAAGSFNFALAGNNGFPIGKDSVINAAINGNLRFTGYVQATSLFGQPIVKLNPASTLATELLRGEAYRVGKALGDFDLAKFYSAAALTDTAIGSGDIAEITTVKDQTNAVLTVGTFDFRIDHLANLRNQYVIAMSAVNAANTTLKSLSDTWKSLLGYRPVAVTSRLGKDGAFPTVGTGLATFGFATGDQRDPTTGATGPGVGSATDAGQFPLGYNYGVCASKGGDVFVSCYTTVAFSGHIRWLHPDGRVTSLWLPTYPLGTPTGICIETDAGPGQSLDALQETSSHGTLLVADQKFNTVLRVPIIDHPFYVNPLLPSAQLQEMFRMSAVAGDSDPAGPGGIATYYPDLYADHPAVVDAAAADPATDGLSPNTSNWRAGEEGARTYKVGNGTTHLAGSPIAGPARYARLDRPNDVKVDELGNIYICDQLNARIRFVPSASAIALRNNYFDYHAPTVDTSGYVTGFSPAPTPMAAGSMYTIVGNPTWDAVKAFTHTNGKWFGEFLVGGLSGDSVPAYQTHLAQPYGITLHTEGGDAALYIAELDNQRVRRVSRSTGVISTFAGNPPEPQLNNGRGDYNYALNPSGDGGDGGPAGACRLSSPKSIAFDVQGRAFIADSDSGRLRMVDTRGVITTVAGRLHGPSIVLTDSATDGEALRWVDLIATEQLCIDAQGNLLFNDLQHQRLRKLWRQWE